MLLESYTNTKLGFSISTEVASGFGIFEQNRVVPVYIEVIYIIRDLGESRRAKDQYTREFLAG